MIEWFEDGGAVMYLLAVLSLLTWLIIIERVIVLQKMKQKISHLFKKIKLEECNLEEVESILEDSNYFIGYFYDYQSPKKCNASQIMFKIDSKVQQWSRFLFRGITFLDVVAVIAPLLGLLGTMLGMIDIFAQISGGNIGDPTLLSKGISKALNTTVFGLVVAIPAYVAFSFFNRTLVALIEQMERACFQVLDLFKSDSK